MEEGVFIRSGPVRRRGRGSPLCRRRFIQSKAHGIDLKRKQLKEPPFGACGTAPEIKEGTHVPFLIVPSPPP